MSDKGILCAGRAARDRAWGGTVHSLFASAANIVSDGAMYTLITNPLWISEKSVVVDSALLRRLHTGSVISSDTSRLYMNGLPVAMYNGAPVWTMPRITFSHPTKLPMLEKCLRGAPGSTMARQVEKMFLETAGRFSQGEDADFTNIIGAGHGLTPAGDDMLTGFALALVHSAPGELRRLSRLCRPLLKNTTDISGYLLADALAGRFASPLVAVLLCLHKGTGLDAALKTALAVGSSSGRDGLFGLFHGLRLTCPPVTPPSSL